MTYVWTDGSCNNHTHNNGGYGIVIKQRGSLIELAGGQYINTTSSRMEILAILRALEHVGDVPVILTSDSEYCVNTINKGWLANWAKVEFKGRLNADLWRKVLSLLTDRTEPIEFKWIRGHSDCVENERADQLATIGSTYKVKVIDR